MLLIIYLDPVKACEIHDNLMEPDSMFSDTKNTGVTRDSFNVGIASNDFIM